MVLDSKRKEWVDSAMHSQSFYHGKFVSYKTDFNEGAWALESKEDFRPRNIRKEIHSKELHTYTCESSS